MAGDVSSISAQNLAAFGQTYIDENTGRTKTATLIGGLDPLEVAKKMAEAQRKPAEFYQKQIDLAVTKKLPELKLLEQKTCALQQAAAQLKNFTGGNSTVPNVFQQKFVQVQPNSDNCVGLLVTNDAVSSPNSLIFTVQQLAKNDSVGTDLSSIFNPIISSPNVDPTVALNLTGNLVVNGQTINITPVMALNDINTAITSASIPNVTSGISGGTTAGNSSYLFLASNPTSPAISLAGTDPAISAGLGLQTAEPTNVTVALGMTGSLVINGQTVAITPTMTLTDIYNGINAIGTTANVTAQLLNLSSTSGYKLYITSNSTAVPIDFTGTSPSLQGTNNGLGLPTSNTNVSSLQAQFTYNSNPIVRNTNSVTDLISGITVNLQSVSPTSPTPGQTTAVIGNDVNAILSAIQDLVAKYNDLVQEINKNQSAKIDGQDGKVTPNEDAVLYGNSILSNLKGFLINFGGGLVEGLNADIDYTSLAQTGIGFSTTKGDLNSISVSGQLVIDQDVLNAAVNNNLAMVTKLFGNGVTCASSYFSVFEFPSSLNTSIAGQPITVSYQKNIDGTYSATLNGIAATIDPTRPKLIVGATGSIFEGLTIGYSSSAPDPIAGGAPVTTTVTLTQGLADILNNDLSNALQKRSNLNEAPQGLFDGAIDLLIKKEDMLKHRIKRINESADRFVKNFEARIGQIYKAADNAKKITGIIDSYKDLMARKR